MKTKEEIEARNNAYIAATMFWSAERLQNVADDASEELLEFMKTKKVDLRKYMELTRSEHEKEAND